MSTSPPLLDQPARERIASDLTTTLVVEAAAGTGKTTALTRRIIAILEQGHARLDQLVALTFTEKAAGEMKLRLRGALEARLLDRDADERARERLQAALRTLETAHIGTIHGFCSDLLQERPIEAGIDPGFRVCAAEDAQQLLDEVFDQWFHASLEAPPEGLRRALRRSRERSSPMDDLRRAAQTLIEQRDFNAAWRRPPLDRQPLIEGCLADLQMLGRFAAHAANPRDSLAQDLHQVHVFAQEQATFTDTLGAPDYDALEANLSALCRKPIWRRRGSGAYFGKELPREQVLQERAAVYERLQSAVHALEADLSATLHQELQTVVCAYEQHKRSQGMLDFLDLLLCTRNLLRDQTSVRRAMQQRYSHLFLDEFQDVDPLQAEIVAALCSDSESLTFGDPNGPCVPAGKLFVVGDPKQAIYRFRRADVRLYERIKQALRSQGAAVVQLTTNFRALPELQSVVNAAFDKHMRGTADGVQAQYQPLQPRRASRSGPTVIALPVPVTVGHRGWQPKSKIAESTADAVGALVAQLCGSGAFTVEEGGRSVPLEPRHICLLLRRFRSFGQEATLPYVHALSARSVPHVLVGGNSFHQREEVVAVRTALRAIEWPDDPLHVYATLRGPLMALRDEALWHYLQEQEALDPLTCTGTSAAEHAEVQEALMLLKRLHGCRNQRSVAETLWDLLTSVRAHANLALWQDGRQALSNLRKLLDLAHRFESRGTTSFRAFWQWLQSSAERSDLRDTPTQEESSNAVRIMTAHNAKGLEFPVVILCDPTVPREGGFPSRYLDVDQKLWATTLCSCQPHELRDHQASIAAEDDAEEIRVGYVAATRAKDMLVVPVGDGEPIRGWLDVLEDAVTPRPGISSPSAPPPALPPAQGDNAPSHGEWQPGYYPPRTGTHPLLVWDLRTLELGRLPRGGLRHQELLVDHGDATQLGLDAYERWRARREQALAQGTRITRAAVSVTQVARDMPTATTEPEPQRLQVPGPRTGRPGGKRFGTLVHAVLADSEFRQDSSWLAGLCALHGRNLGATPEEMLAAQTACAQALLHPVLLEAAASPDHRFEAPFIVVDKDERLLEGVIDLVYRRPTPEGGWVVVDFKTDAPTASAAYTTQVRLYVKAVAQLTGEAVAGVLLGV